MILSNAIGKKVKMQTPAGVVEGTIKDNCCLSLHGRGNKNQIAVEYNYTGSGFTNITGLFSKKTGRPYNCKRAKELGIKILEF